MSNPEDIQNALIWGLNRLAKDQKTTAERAWNKSAQARVAQAPCDEGLFGDSAKQADLFTSNTARKK